MAIIQCPNNHYYDNARNSSCPYCQKLSMGSNANDFNEQLTSYVDPIGDENEVLTEAYGESVAEYEKTIGVFIDEKENILTVGWLVCTEGFQKGKSYVIHAGRNFAGRSLDMDIVLADDGTISREKHFSIVFDPKSLAFYLVSGSGHTYVNDMVVSSQQELFDGDVVKAGNSEYVFVPFCKEGREW